MNIVIWICFAVMIAIALTSAINVAKRGRADRLEYYKNYKKGKFWAIYFVAIPLFYLAHSFNGSSVGESIVEAVKSSVDLVVLKYDYSTAEPLMNANPLFKAAMITCFVFVALNASFLALTIAGRRILNYVWKKKAKKSKKCYVIVGYNPQNKAIAKSVMKKGAHQKCILVSDSITDDLKNFAFVEKIAYAKVNSLDDFAKKLRELFKDYSNRSVEVIVNTGDDKNNLAFVEQIVDVIDNMPIEDCVADSERGLNAYVFGEPENVSIFDKFVKASSGLVHFVNKYKLVAYDFIDKYPLTEFMDETQIDFDSATIKSNVSINVAMLGFGKTNRQIFLASVENNQFMTIKDGKTIQKAVNYWIYDKEDARNDKNLNHDYYRIAQDIDGKDCLPLPEKLAKEAFFKLDVNDDDFYTSLHNNLIAKENERNFNYLIVAFGSDLENLDFAEKICSKLKEWEIFDYTKVFVKIRDGKFKHKVIDRFDGSADYIVFGDENKLVYNIDTIVNEKSERMALDRHICYALAYAAEYQTPDCNAQSVANGKIVDVDKQKEKKKAIAEWYTQSRIQRDANIYGVLALRMKLQLMGYDYCDKSSPEQDASQEFLQQYQKDDEIQKSGKTVEGRSVVNYCNDAFDFGTLRGRMAMQEHQRWNAYMITCGVIPMPIYKMKQGIFKDFELRRHGCLTTFDGLVEYRKIRAEVTGKTEEECDVIRYDYQILDDAKWILDKANAKIIKKKMTFADKNDTWRCGAK